MAASTVLSSALLVEESQVVDILAPPLEHLFRRPDVVDPSALSGIMVAGGRSYLRVPEAGNLARQYPQLKVYVSGAGDASDVLEWLGPGIEVQRIIIDDRAKSTYQNAKYMAEIFSPKPDARWLLVTSAIHMPRAVATFRKAGIDVEPWPVYDSKVDPYSLGDALREWLGLLGYRMLGRTNELLPSPRDYNAKVAAVGAVK